MGSSGSSSDGARADVVLAGHRDHQKPAVHCVDLDLEPPVESLLPPAGAVTSEFLPAPVRATTA